MATASTPRLTKVDPLDRTFAQSLDAGSSGSAGSGFAGDRAPGTGRCNAADADDGLQPTIAARTRELGVLSEMAEGRSTRWSRPVPESTEKALSKHLNSILAKRDLPPSDDHNRRVRAVLAYLNAGDCGISGSGNGQPRAKAA